MDDLIRRQEAVRAYCESQCGKGMIRGECGCDDCGTIFDDIPSAEPEQRWISCSERLPKAFEYCLWTTTDGKVVYHYCDGQFSKYIAWMPLPEPARLEKDNG